MSDKRIPFIGVIFLVAVTLVSFWPVLGHDFVHYDDDLYVSENPHLVGGMTWEGLKWALTVDLLADTPHADLWIPVTYVSHLLAVELFGMDPFGHHLINLVLHLLNAVLLFWVFQRMTGIPSASLFVAALFAVHPLHVESVAWVTERKDVLSTFFGMLTLGLYLRYTEKPGMLRYLWVMITFALGLMSKPILVTWPLVLLLLDAWPLGRFPLRDSWGPGELKTIRGLVLEKVPLMGLAAGSGIIAVRGEAAMGTFEMFPLEVRIGNALVSYVMYIRKTVWPIDLAVFYPHPGDALSLGQAAAAGCLLGLISVWVVRRRRSQPYLVTGWFWYLLVLAPVIGILQVGSQSMADRYTYLSLIGLFIMAAWGISDLVLAWQIPRAGWVAVAALVVLAFSACTRKQVSHWRNDIALFEHAVQVTDRNVIARNNLGAAYMKQGRLEEALTQFREALEINPDHPESQVNLGMIHVERKRPEEAIREFEAAIALRPDYAEAHYYLGNAYFNLGRLEEAMESYKTAIRFKPDFAEAYYNLAVLYGRLGKKEEGSAAYGRAVRIKPELGLKP